ncbi:MAG: glycosyltransferase family 1 protein [Patescibacteria group bacterium]|jgi:glycosyltransferase involved in cell wall biosynthesis
MKIGIDITMLVYAGSGVANYTFNLAKNLLEIDKENEYRLFYSSLRRPKNFYYLDELKKAGGKIYDYKFPPTLLQLWWSKLHIIPVEWFIGKVDVFFSSDFLRPPLLPGTRGITTVHDLTWKLFPQYHEERIIRAHEKKLAKTIKYNDTIIVDSINTKQDLLKLYSRINNEKITVLYPGIGEQFKQIDNNKIKQILTKYSILNTKYLLYVGAIEPRKNLVRSIEVFSELIKDKKFSDFKFIIAGRAGWKNEDVFERIKRLKLENKVKFIGFVEDEDLPYLYNAASLTVYLSSYEGFGLPPLESLACGTKVIAGDNSSLIETIDKKFLVNVNDKDKILEKMKYLLGNKIVINSDEIKKRFNWKESAKRFLKIII